MHKMKYNWPIVAAESWMHLIEKNPLAQIALSSACSKSTGNVTLCIWEPKSGIKFGEVTYAPQQFLEFCRTIGQVELQVRSIVREKTNQTERKK